MILDRAKGQLTSGTIVGFSFLTAYSAEAQRILGELVKREEWQAHCYALGATAEQVRAYEQDARRFAMTMRYPNHLIIDHARRLASRVLARGEPMPEDAEQLLRDDNRRQMARLFGLNETGDTKEQTRAMVSIAGLARRLSPSNIMNKKIRGYARRCGAKVAR